MTGTSATFHTNTLERYKIGHKYYYSSDVAGSGLTNRFGIQYGANFYVAVTSDPFSLTRVSSIITPYFTPEYAYLYYMLSGESGSTLQLRNVNMIDLTLMFGAGNEPSTASQVEEWLAQNVGTKEYYAYDNRWCL